MRLKFDSFCLKNWYNLTEQNVLSFPSSVKI